VKIDGIEVKRFATREEAQGYLDEMNNNALAAT
jgi:hypothetical protein